MSESENKYFDNKECYESDRYLRDSSKYDNKNIDPKVDNRRDGESHRQKKHRVRDHSYRSKSKRNKRSSLKNKSKKRKRKKDRRERYSSSSSGSNSTESVSQELSSSESSDDETTRKKQALIAERVATNQMKANYKNETKRQKEIIKSLETTEEKRLRRLEKKEKKGRKRKLKRGWNEEYVHYTNDDNPFGDANLYQTFNWKKKYEKMGIKNLSEEEISQMNKLKMESTKRELEVIKQRREEREHRIESRHEEMSRQQREKEAEQFKEWEEKEEYFDLEQAKLRSQMRIKEERAKPIDLLVRYINTFGDDIGGDYETNKTEQMVSESIEPYFYLNGLRISDLEDLDKDIKVYMTLDSDKNSNYWSDLKIIVGDELCKLRKIQTKNAVERRHGINSAITPEVLQVITGKTSTQLQTLQTQIEEKILSNEEGIDIGFWETVLSRLRPQLSKTRLKEIHEQNIQRSNPMFVRENKETNIEIVSKKPLFPIEVRYSFNVEEEEPTFTTLKNETKSKSEENITEPMDPTIKCIEDYKSGEYSPKLLSFSEIEIGILITTPEEDLKQLEIQRKQVMRAEAIQRFKRLTLCAEEAAFEREARMGMTNEETVFNVEEEIKKIDKMYSWSDKHRPRKPRYLNRVHNGFEWNKYNQTHYDIDHPPPKVVHGYKFNIFYPNLIDRSNPPKFKVTPCPENNDFAFIRFSSGAPYEDICFKIVNREWNYSHKSGFRSQFRNNILQLWFNFKRLRYRR